MSHDRRKTHLMGFFNDCDHPVFLLRNKELLAPNTPQGKQPDCQGEQGLGHIRVAEDCHRLGAERSRHGVIYIPCGK